MLQFQLPSDKAGRGEVDAKKSKVEEYGSIANSSRQGEESEGLYCIHFVMVMNEKFKMDSLVLTV